ncbi:MAG TPA: hypothetical protein VNE63_09965 [Candidatus Acidoferrales bacterium]|nr:hypothetical protein [Candidatus Acidoferrales bacterium]
MWGRSAKRQAFIYHKPDNWAEGIVKTRRAREISLSRSTTQNPLGLSWPCQQCGQPFDGQRGMADHVRIKHDGTDVCCFDCGAVVARNRIGSHRKWICPFRVEVRA